MLCLPALVLSSPVPDRAHAPRALDATSGSSPKHPWLLYQMNEDEYQKRPTYDSSYTCTFGPSYTGELTYYKEGYHATGMDQIINVGTTDQDKAYAGDDFESYRGTCSCAAKGAEDGAGYNSECYFAKQTSSSTDHSMCLHSTAEGGVCTSNVIRMLSQKDEFCSSPSCFNREDNEYLCRRPDFLTECSCPQRCEWVDDPDNSGINTNKTTRMNFCQATECVGTAAESPAGKPPNWGGACTPGADGKIPAECPCPTAFAQTHNSCLPESVKEAVLPPIPTVPAAAPDEKQQEQEQQAQQQQAQQQQQQQQQQKQQQQGQQQQQQQQQQQEQAQQQQQQQAQQQEQQAEDEKKKKPKEDEVVAGEACGCDPTKWKGYDKQADKVCGPCAALVNVNDFGFHCQGFCAAQGLACIEGWDDTTNEECSHGATVRSCLYSYHQHTSDAICSCGCPADDLSLTGPVDDDAPAVDIASNDDDESEEEVDPDDPEDHAGHDHDDEDAPDVTSDVFDDDAPPSPSTVTVGNDPMMKLHGGKFVKFSLSPGILSPLLSWTSHRQVRSHP